MIRSDNSTRIDCLLAYQVTSTKNSTVVFFNTTSSLTNSNQINIWMIFTVFYILLCEEMATNKLTMWH